MRGLLRRLRGELADDRLQDQLAVFERVEDQALLLAAAREQRVEAALAADPVADAQDAGAGGEVDVDGSTIVLEAEPPDSMPWKTSSGARLPIDRRPVASTPPASASCSAVPHDPHELARGLARDRWNVCVSGSRMSVTSG